MVSSHGCGEIDDEQAWLRKKKTQVWTAQADVGTQQLAERNGERRRPADAGRPRRGGPNGHVPSPAVPGRAVWGARARTTVPR
jgi:hypothetical protein